MATVTADSTQPHVPAVKGDGVNLGVVGTAQDGWAILGESKKQVGVVGRCEDGWGVSGESKTQVGVRGVCYPGWGVTGESKAGLGVLGVCESGAGVLGDSKTADGVFGKSENGRGVVGVAKIATGVEGNSTSGTGVYGSSQTGVGVHGKGGRLAGLFEGNVDITGNLTIQGSTIQAMLQRIDRLEREVISLRHLLATHTHASGGSSAGSPSASVATIHVEIDLSGFSQSFATRRVSGGGFNANEVIAVKTTSADGVTTESSATARADGTYSQELSVSKSTPPKQYSVWAEGSSSRRVTPKIGYSV